MMNKNETWNLAFCNPCFFFNVFYFSRGNLACYQPLVIPFGAESVQVHAMGGNLDAGMRVAVAPEGWRTWRGPKWAKNGICWVGLVPIKIHFFYPLVMTNIAMENQWNTNLVGGLVEKKIGAMPKWQCWGECYICFNKSRRSRIVNPCVCPAGAVLATLMPASTTE